MYKVFTVGVLLALSFGFSVIGYTQEIAEPSVGEAWASALTEATESPLIRRGTVEVSTLGPLMGSNLLGLGASLFKDNERFKLKKDCFIGHIRLVLEGTHAFSKERSARASVQTL